MEYIISNAKAKLTERRELLEKLDSAYSRISSIKELKLAVLSNDKEGDNQLEKIIQDSWNNLETNSKGILKAIEKIKQTSGYFSIS